MTQIITVELWELMVVAGLSFLLGLILGAGVLVSIMLNRSCKRLKELVDKLNPKGV